MKPYFLMWILFNFDLGNAYCDNDKEMNNIPGEELLIYLFL